MPSNPETFYLTAQEYRGKTTLKALITPLSNEEVEELLLETMAILDAYVGEGWTPFDDDQEFTFPRSADEDDDGNPFIPRSIALATRMIADAIVEEREKGVLPHMVASEAADGHSHTKHARIVEPQQGFDVIPPSALALLAQYKRVGGQWAVEEPDVVG